MEENKENIENIEEENPKSVDEKPQIVKEGPGKWFIFFMLIVALLIVGCVIVISVLNSLS